MAHPRSTLLALTLLLGCGKDVADTQTTLDRLETCSKVLSLSDAPAAERVARVTEAVRTSAEHCRGENPYRGCDPEAARRGGPALARACTEAYCSRLSPSPRLCGRDIDTLESVPIETLEDLFSEFHVAMLAHEYELLDTPRLDATARRFAQVWLAYYRASTVTPPSRARFPRGKGGGVTGMFRP